ncbi:hypothetical protein GQ53DRAFT_783549 [Thozetella sp. PMI_491]|nr:hypothetical protein GQ53DRAFT_783549 [Thozetella sp. PMI_491]
MKFFRKKEKRKDGSANTLSLPGYGGGLAYGQKKSGGGNGYRQDGWEPFGSPPLSPYGAPGGNEQQFRAMATHASAAALANLPAAILARIFAFVCPHTRDESYETCEQSSIEDACMLCDLRDLAHCVQVTKKWKIEARKLLYHSIRIDSVHYCQREAILADKRKRRSFFDRNGEPEDTTQARLKLLCRTLRSDPARLGPLVEFFKIPYMLRESCQADLARTIAVLPNLKYVDLPEGMFQDDPPFMTLRLEVQARCQHLRKMTYLGGSERSLQALATGSIWTQLEVLELIHLEIDPTILRQVLGALGNLRALKITDNNSITDEVLGFHEMLPHFPPLEEFILTNVPGVSHVGLAYWLELEAARLALKVLTLNNTGVKAWALQSLVAFTPALNHLSIVDTVAAAIYTAAGTSNIPPLASTSLQTLHYEISAAPSTSKFAGVAGSYYNYLASSLLQGGLPSLTAVYVREPNFPDMLLGLAPPAPAFAEGGIARPASSGSSTSAFSGGFSNASLSPGYAPVSPQGFLSPSGTGPHYGGTRPFQPQSHLAPNPFQDASRPKSFSPGFPAPSGNWQPGHNPRFSSNNPFAAVTAQSTGGSNASSFGNGIANLPAMLEVFTKGDDELDWSFVKVNPGSQLPSGRRGSNARPLSSYGLKADTLGGNTAGWSSGGGARRSVLVGGAGGGFLAVPDDAPSSRRTAGGGGEDFWPRPLSSAGETRREKLDLWR